MNDVFEMVATATDEELMRDIEEVVADMHPTEKDEALQFVLEQLMEARINAVRQVAALDRLIALTHRYGKEAKT